MTDAGFRIAVRREGAMINAYVAEMGTMEGSLLLASINAAVCEQDPVMFDRFKRLCETAVRSMVRGIGVEVARFQEMVPPPGEVAGRA
jgi:hypothetical protein